MIHHDIHDVQGVRVAVLRVAHGKANAIDVEFFESLIAALNEVESSDVQAVVLTGSGRNFSAGVQLFAVIEGGHSYLQEFLPVLSEGLRRLFTFPRPVIAAINGHAIAGGCILALAADRRICVSEGAKLGVTELMVGVPFPSAPLEVVRHHLPLHVAQDLILTARLVAPDEALKLGLVDELRSAEELLERAVGTAAKMGQIPSRTFAVSKRQLRGDALAAMDRGAETYDEEVREIWAAPQTLDGIRRFMDATVRGR
ncbi:MAG: enoyl-CoA hydratase/isomerase family protein [Thermoanaerobaculia bacterium]|nr:enoyl-CoA hydratase/isomerase family protein [Thermoanaerobaculia bacterium]